MSTLDKIDIAGLILAGFCVLGLFILGHVNFKNKRLQLYSEYAQRFMHDYVNFWDKQSASNPEKLDGAINDTVAALQGKGFKVTDQELKDIEAGVEAAVTRLRLEQAKAGNETEAPKEAEKPSDNASSDNQPEIDVSPDDSL